MTLLAATVHMNLGPEWDALVNAGLEKLLVERLGPDILEDQHRAVPVDTGELEASLDMRVHHDDDGKPSIDVGSLATPDRPGGVPYCLAVEFGFHGLESVRTYTTSSGRVVPAHIRQGNSPEQPYIRPSAYRRRSP